MLILDGSKYRAFLVFSGRLTLGSKTGYNTKFTCRAGEIPIDDLYDLHDLYDLRISEQTDPWSMLSARPIDHAAG